MQSGEIVRNIPGKAREIKDTLSSRYGPKAWEKKKANRLIVQKTDIQTTADIRKSVIDAQSAEKIAEADKQKAAIDALAAARIKVIDDRESERSARKAKRREIRKKTANFAKKIFEKVRPKKRKERSRPVETVAPLMQEEPAKERPTQPETTSPAQQAEAATAQDEKQSKGVRKPAIPLIPYYMPPASRIPQPEEEGAPPPSAGTPEPEDQPQSAEKATSQPLQDEKPPEGSLEDRFAALSLLVEQQGSQIQSLQGEIHSLRESNSALIAANEALRQELQGVKSENTRLNERLAVFEQRKADLDQRDKAVEQREIYASYFGNIEASQNQREATLTGTVIAAGQRPADNQQPSVAGAAGGGAIAVSEQQNNGRRRRKGIVPVVIAAFAGGFLGAAAYELVDDRILDRDNTPAISGPTVPGQADKSASSSPTSTAESTPANPPPVVVPRQTPTPQEPSIQPEKPAPRAEAYNPVQKERHTTATADNLWTITEDKVEDVIDGKPSIPGVNAVHGVVEALNQQLTDPDLIRPGDKIKLPKDTVAETVYYAATHKIPDNVSGNERRAWQQIRNINQQSTEKDKIEAAEEFLSTTKGMTNEEVNNLLSQFKASYRLYVGNAITKGLTDGTRIVIYK